MCRLCPLRRQPVLSSFLHPLVGALFPRGRSAAQRRALKRRYVAIEVTGPLQVGGGPFDVRLKIARKEAGRNGPQGPGVN